MSQEIELRLESTLGCDDDKKKDRPEGFENKLLDSRQILIEGPVTDKMYHAVCGRILYLEHADPEKEITIIVNSPGGSADTGFGIYDLLKFVKCPVKAICAGMCASAAVLIFLGGDKGRRFMLPHSRFLIHQPSTTTFGTASDMEITAREILRTRRRYAEIVAEEVGSNADKVMEDSNRDFWLDADECIKYGLVNKVARQRSDTE